MEDCSPPDQSKVSSEGPEMADNPLRNVLPPVAIFQLCAETSEQKPMVRTVAMRRRYPVEILYEFLKFIIMVVRIMKWVS